MRHAILAVYGCEMVNAGKKTGVMGGRKPRKRQPTVAPGVIGDAPRFFMNGDTPWPRGIFGGARGRENGPVEWETRGG